MESSNIQQSGNYQGMAQNAEHGAQEYGQNLTGQAQQHLGQSENYSQTGTQKMEQGMNGYTGGAQQQHGGAQDSYYGQQNEGGQDGGNYAGEQQTTYNAVGGGQQNGYQQSGAQGQPGQGGASYPNSKAPDALHNFLDRIEKKFGGERFNNPANDEKNKALNENIIKKLKQVMTIVMQRGPQMAMQYGSKLMH